MQNMMMFLLKQELTLYHVYQQLYKKMNSVLHVIIWQIWATFILTEKNPAHIKPKTPKLDYTECIADVCWFSYVNVSWVNSLVSSVEPGACLTDDIATQFQIRLKYVTYIISSLLSVWSQ